MDWQQWKSRDRSLQEQVCHINCLELRQERLQQDPTPTGLWGYYLEHKNRHCVPLLLRNWMSLNSLKVCIYKAPTVQMSWQCHISILVVSRGILRKCSSVEFWQLDQLVLGAGNPLGMSLQASFFILHMDTTKCYMTLDTEIVLTLMIVSEHCNVEMCITHVYKMVAHTVVKEFSLENKPILLRQFIVWINLTGLNAYLTISPYNYLAKINNLCIYDAIDVIISW